MRNNYALSRLHGGYNCLIYDEDHSFGCDEYELWSSAVNEDRLWEYSLEIPALSSTYLIEKLDDISDHRATLSALSDKKIRVCKLGGSHPARFFWDQMIL